MSALRLCGLAILCTLAASCGPSATDGGFESANPAAKMYAIEDAVRTGDQQSIPQLVEQLDSDDPGVRFLAIAALERLTGQTYGYRDYDPVEQRREAIDRWKTAVQSGQVPVAEPDGGDFADRSNSSPAKADQSDNG